LARQQQAAVALALSQTTGYDYDAFNEALGGAGEMAAAAAATAGERLSELAALQSAGTDTSAGIGALDMDSQLELAQLAVDQLQDALDKMRFSSRISGTVLVVNVHKGEVLAPGVPAMVIADTGSTEITGYVYEKDVDNLSAGMEVTIVTENGNRNGTLTRIGQAAADIGEASTFDTMTKVTIAPGDGFSKMPGAVVDLKIVLSAKRGVLSIPTDCLTDDGCVYVVGGEDIVEKRPVTTGFMDMFNVEVTGGLAEGERVVTAPGSVKEGQHVSYDRG
jgi:HlyD family secretion protein